MGCFDMELASASCYLLVVAPGTSVLSHGVVWVWHGPSVRGSNTARKGASPARPQHLAMDGGGHMLAIRPLKKYFRFTSLSLNYYVLPERVTLSKSVNLL